MGNSPEVQWLGCHASTAGRQVRSHIYIYICYAMLSCSVMSNFVTPWTAVHQAPLSMGFSRQEYWSGLPCPLSRNLPNPGIEPRSPTLQADSLPSKPPGKPMNNGVGSLSFHQGIFSTQESNQVSCIADGFFTS